jgi:hypothetical protein
MKKSLMMVFLISLSLFATDIIKPVVTPPDFIIAIKAATGTWNKQAIIDDLNTRYKGIGIPVNPHNEGPINGVTKYVVNVNEVGISSDKKPTGDNRNIAFYVLDEGKDDEYAWYERYSFTSIHDNGPIRARIFNTIINSLVSIQSEDAGITNHPLRLAWSNDAMKDPNKYLEAFMCFYSNDATIQATGMATSDDDFQAAFDNSLPIIAAAFGIVAAQ